MSKLPNNSYQDWDCEESCKSLVHGQLVINAITEKRLTDIQVACYLNAICRNFAKVHDSFGRTALHVAASCGRTELCLWLLEAGANINAKDFESGSTALHRSIYHGHINTAVKLIEAGSEMRQLNNEDHSPLSLLTMDVAQNVRLSFSEPCEIYVWGSNLNYTLGTGTDNPRKTPEILDFFKRNYLSVRQACMDEFHSVFVTSCHRVWVCGHGQGGRLGVGKTKPLLVPTEMNLKGESCEKAATSVNHTLVLLTGGTVMACGSNQHHQLGILPYAETSNSLRPVSLHPDKSLSRITGIGAGKYHSIFYNSRVIFACGLNAGQFGQKTLNSSFMSVPSQISMQLREHIYITLVATSSGAVTYATNAGDVYVIHQFNQRKIASKLKDILTISCYGGYLSSQLIEDTGEDLRVAILHAKGPISIWRNNSILSKCIFGIGRPIQIRNIFLNSNSLLLVSELGEAFVGTIKEHTICDRLLKDEKTISVNQKPPEPTGYVYLSLKPIPNIHRAVDISSDPKGKNFSVIQTNLSNHLPDIWENHILDFNVDLKNLLDNVSEDDSLHDMLITVEGKKFPVHRYILVSRECSLGFHSESTLILNNVQPIIFEELLTYIYTNHCKLFEEGECCKSFLKLNENPLELLGKAASNFGVQSLIKKLKDYRFLDGFIECTKSFVESRQMIKFDRKLCPDLYDVEFKCEDKTIVPAHKCILAARLEYFNSMFLRGWSETKKRQTINLHCSSNVVNQLLHFIYTQEIFDVISLNDVDMIIRLLIISDQYLVNDLKEQCEFMLKNLLSLRNCTTIIQCAVTYNAFRLKALALQFICLHLNALLETRQLEYLDDKLLDELRDYYRTNNRISFGKRDVAPCDNCNSEDICAFLNNISIGSTEMPNLFIQAAENLKHIKKQQNIPKKKTPKKNSLSTSPQKETFIYEQMKSAEPNILPSSYEEEDQFFKSFDFPSLESYSANYSPSPPKSNQNIRKVFPPRLSQKARKKSLLETEEVKSPPPAVKTSNFKGWGVVAPVETSKVTSDPIGIPREQPAPVETNLIDIIANEYSKRSNYFKMKSKSFHLTQIEDSAMVGLLEFYNADNVFDEKITVNRVLPINIAEPTWIPSHKQLVL